MHGRSRTSILTTDRTLLITEIMANPNAVDDNDGEYAEVTNVSGELINVEGLVLSDDTPTHMATVTGPLVLAAGESMLFLINDDPTANGGLSGVDTSFNFGNSGDEAAILYGGTEIHRVTYPGTGNDLSNTGTGQVAGQSFNLDQAYLDGTTATPTWCLTPLDPGNVYNTVGGNSDYGTPGAANLVCP